MSARVTLADRLADYFKARPNVWIDGMELARIAGSYAWRSRCSDIRRTFGMVIENRVRWVPGYNGESMRKVSEYRYAPAAQESEVA